MTTTMTCDPWRHPDPRRSQLSLVQVPAAVLDGLAQRTIRVEDDASLTPYVLSDACARLWRRRSEQVRRIPSDAPWVTRFVLLPDVAGAVGVAGFHGPPDVDGIVEVGYRIDPFHRRKGCAGRALETLLSVAGAHPDVRVVRATVSPDNNISRHLVERYGFIEVGERWDDDDGIEIILEVSANENSVRRP